MPIYYIDANYFLRFILKDNLAQWKIANNYFEKAMQEPKYGVIYYLDTTSANPVEIPIGRWSPIFIKRIKQINLNIKKKKDCPTKHRDGNPIEIIAKISLAKSDVNPDSSIETPKDLNEHEMRFRLIAKGKSHSFSARVI